MRYVREIVHLDARQLLFLPVCRFDALPFHAFLSDFLRRFFANAPDAPESPPCHTDKG